MPSSILAVISFSLSLLLCFSAIYHPFRETGHRAEALRPSPCIIHPKRGLCFCPAGRCRPPLRACWLPRDALWKTAHGRKHSFWARYSFSHRRRSAFSPHTLLPDIFCKGRPAFNQPPVVGVDAGGIVCIGKQDNCFAFCGAQLHAPGFSLSNSSA